MKISSRGMNSIVAIAPDINGQNTLSTGCILAREVFFPVGQPTVNVFPLILGGKRRMKNRKENSRKRHRRSR